MLCIYHQFEERARVESGGEDVHGYCNNKDCDFYREKEEEKKPEKEDKR